MPVTRHTCLSSNHAVETMAVSLAVNQASSDTGGSIPSCGTRSETTDGLVSQDAGTPVL